MAAGALPWAEFARRAPRPRYSALGSTRGLLLPDLDFAIHRFVSDQQST